jgi:hypothetical protein
MKSIKNRVPNFDTFVRLDEQANMEESSLKMIKSKLKSAAYNASSALSLLESNPGVEIEPYIIAQIAVASDYMDHIEEYFRNYENEGTEPAPTDGMDLGAIGGDETMPDAQEEGAEGDDDDEDPTDSSDDETEDEVEDSPEDDKDEE